jgi:multidrug efflux pump subunit AcrA (membrane-fusion protein)
VGGALFALRQLRQKPEEETVYVVREEVYRNVIEISGNIKAAQQQNLQAAGDGTVEQVYVKEGDRVKAGQILFRLNDSQERYNLANHDFLMAQERINGVSARLTLLEEQREVYLKQIRDRRLEARFDGVIAQLSLASGDYAKAQDTFGYLIDRSYLKATVEVVETDAPRLKAGQQVALIFPAYPELQVEGVVVSFPAVGRVATRGATVLDTEIRIARPPDEILPGYSFTGEILGGPEERVLTVENAAIAYENGVAYAERYAERYVTPGEARRQPGGPRPEGQGAGEGSRAGPRPERGAGDGPQGERSGGTGAEVQPERGAGDRGEQSSGTGAGVPPEGGQRPDSARLPTETERLRVEVVPYGRNMVRVLSGLEAGDRLKAQAAADGLFSGGRRGSARSPMGIRLF